MATSKRPRRQRKDDRMRWGTPDTPELRCDYALAPFDRMSEEMDKKWGVDRLVELVSTETAEKYASAMGKLNKAIADQDPDEVVKRAAVCIRGMQAMDQEAEAAGAEPADQRCLEVVTDDGEVIGILADKDAWKAVQAQRPDMRLYTLHEVQLALTQLDRLAAGCKQAFPGSEVVEVRKKGEAEKADAPDAMEDEIPF